MSANGRTETEIRADIAVFETARTNAAQGKSITITTSAGTRTVTQQDLSEITEELQRLYRELMSCLAAQSPPVAQGLHNFALANIGDNGANQ